MPADNLPFLNMVFPERWRGLVLCLGLLAMSASADPQDFMVDVFTFVRPPSWNWVWDEQKAKAGMLLEIPGTTVNEKAVVYFPRFKNNEGSPEKRIKNWQGAFKEVPDQLHIRSQTTNVAGFTLTYIEMEGTYMREGRHPNYSLIGAAIQMKEGHLVIRLSGPKPLVEHCKPTFKQMVERALKQQQLEAQ